jgi:sigma-B regulation protein RsbU (phosphoserine phosphatase)
MLTLVSEVLLSSIMRVLIGDDQPDVLEAARLLLKSSGHLAVTAGTPDAVLREATSQPFDVLLLDMNYARDTTSGREGLDLLRGLRASGVHAPVVVMTAWGAVDLAVEAMRRGASDFVQKPWDNARLLVKIGVYGSQAKRERTDIEIARNVQQNLLGRSGKQVPGLDYAGRCLPAGEIGGDYFDFLHLDQGRLGVALADVSGKGISAALLMATLQAALRSRPELADKPRELIAAINQVFWNSSPSEQYSTLFYGLYDNGMLRYVNAGHASPVLLRTDGLFEKLESTGMPVGMFESWRGEERSVTLHSGDRLAIVSDGVLEAGVRQDCDFGEEGVIRCIRRHARSTAESIVDRLLSEAEQCGVEDDMTAVVLSAI